MEGVIMAQRLDESCYRDRKSNKTDLVPFLLALLPLLGAAIYVSLRGTYASLYSRFGVTPEEVGLDYFAVLTGAIRVIRLGNLGDVYLRAEGMGTVAFFAIIGLLFGFPYLLRRRLPLLARVDPRRFLFGCIAGVSLVVLVVFSVALEQERIPLSRKLLRVIGFDREVYMF
jgi:hypothetical protein